MKTLLFVLIVTVSIAFSNDTDSSKVRNVYVNSPELTEADYNTVFSHVENDSVRLLNSPRLMTVAFYSPDYKGYEFILVHKTVFVTDYDEFYARFQTTCDLYKTKFNGAGEGSLCMVYHDVVPSDAMEFLNFRQHSISKFSTATGCSDRKSCKVRGHR